MCGIAYVKRFDNKPAGKAILKRYHKQKSRGQSGFGFIAVDNCTIERSTQEKEIQEMLKKSEAREVIFHHRFPTSTPNIVESAHPLTIQGGDLKYTWHIVHNGVITNDEVLKLKHEKLGFEYTTRLKKKWITPISTYTERYFNDSEAFAVEVARAIEHGTQIEASGASAFIALQTLKNKPVAMFFGRNEGNPLHAERNDNLWSISSEGAGELICADMLYKYDYATGKISSVSMKIGVYNAPRYLDNGLWGGYGSYKPYGKHTKNCPCITCTASEDDIEYEYFDTLEELEEIEAQIRKASAQQDYDTVYALEQDKRLLELKIQEYEKVEKSTVR